MNCIIKGQRSWRPGPSSLSLDARLLSVTFMMWNFQKGKNLITLLLWICKCVTNCLIICHYMLEGLMKRVKERQTAPHPHYFLERNFFPRKNGNDKVFTGEEYMRLEFIYWARHRWQKVDSFFWICRLSNELSY